VLQLVSIPPGQPTDLLPEIKKPDKIKNGRTRLRMRPVEERTELLFLLADAAGDHLPGRAVPEEQASYLNAAAVGHCDAAVG
jgi:hypothetical protein